jgi:hypothetical protein
MKSSVSVLAALLLAGMALAGEVYVTQDRQGNTVYTDKPETIPAKPVGIRSSSSDPAEVQARYSEQQTKYAAEDKESAKAAAAEAEAAKAGELNDEDRARRCTAARERLQAFKDAHRLYEQDSEGERHYLTSEEIDATRARAQQTMDEFCGTD